MEEFAIGCYALLSLGWYTRDRLSPFRFFRSIILAVSLSWRNYILFGVPLDGSVGLFLVFFVCGVRAWS